MQPLAFVAELLAATASANTSRSLVRALAAWLATEVALDRVELRAVTPLVAAACAGGVWRTLDGEVAPARRAVAIAPGLAVVTASRHPLPAAFADPAFRSVLAHAIEGAVQRLAVVARVADLSRRAHGESRELRTALAIERRATAADDELVARSVAMRDVVERAHLVARHPTTVLVTGESGVGKEVVAREIHRRSPRAERELLHVNCGALPEHLVESELFGHEKGAFTGADRTHVGLFERADHGTLLLDEVGELPPRAQAKLLRAIQERRIRRVGGTAQIAVDVRLIAATNRSLEAMVAAGTFREDLYYRLAVFAIEVPPLRERRGDLAPLVTALVAKLAARLAIVSPPRLTRATLATLEAHAWPGNVRELANVLEAALILGGDTATLVFPASFAAPPTKPAIRPLERAVRDTIEDALRGARGKIYGATGAAARLGIPPATLQSKLARLGIDRARFR